MMEPFSSFHGKVETHAASTQEYGRPLEAHSWTIGSEKQIRRELCLMLGTEFM